MNKLLGINIGVGREYFESTEEIIWHNQDMQDLDGKVDILHDATKLNEIIPPESYDIIVASHILEHVEMSIAQDVLEQWMSLLKKDGKLYLSVPDARALAEAYAVNDIDNYTFAVNMTGPYHNGTHDHHRWCYDYETLKDRAKNFDIKRLYTENELTNEVKSGKLKLDWWILGCVITHK